MSNEVDYKRIASDYILIGILAYVAFIILIVFLRYLIIRKIYIPKSCNECLVCVQSQKCCIEGCSSCQKTRNPSRLCCMYQGDENEESCLDRLPVIGMRCYKPDCTRISCLCCEVYVKNEVVPEDAYVPSDNVEELTANNELFQTYRSNNTDEGAKGDGK